MLLLQSRLRQRLGRFLQALVLAPLLRALARVPPGNHPLFHLSKTWQPTCTPTRPALSLPKYILDEDFETRAEAVHMYASVRADAAGQWTGNWEVGSTVGVVCCAPVRVRCCCNCLVCLFLCCLTNMFLKKNLKKGLSRPEGTIGLNHPGRAKDVEGRFGRPLRDDNVMDAKHAL